MAARSTLLTVALVAACAEPEPPELGEAVNPCGMDGPTRIAEVAYAGGIVELGDTHGTMLGWTPSEIPRRGLADAVSGYRFDVCGRAETEPIPVPLRPAGGGGYVCGALGLRWTDDLAEAPVKLRHAVTDCRGVVVTDHGLWLAEAGTLSRYRTPQSDPEVVVDDIDTESLYARGYSDVIGWPLAMHGDDLFYLATGGVVRSVDVETGRRSLVADGVAAVYGHPERSFVAWTEVVGTYQTTTIFFPDDLEAVQIPGHVESLAQFDDWIVTRGDDSLALYRPETNELRTHPDPTGPTVARIEGGWAYLAVNGFASPQGGAIDALDLSDGTVERLADGLGEFVTAQPNPYGTGLLVHDRSDEQPLGRLQHVGLDGAHELARGIDIPYVLLGDGSVLWGQSDGVHSSVRHRLRSGEERVVAWDAWIVSWLDGAVLQGDALFAVWSEDHAGLWRMPAIP